jgi:hypothetical protein
MPSRLQLMPSQLASVSAELDRLRTTWPPLRGDVEQLLAAIDRQLDVFLDLLALERQEGVLDDAQRALVERALLQLSVLRSRALALQLRAQPGG